MTKAQTLVVNLPFDGFYESLYSAAIDDEESRFVEYRCDGENGDPDYEDWWPEDLRLDASELSSILFDVTNYADCYAQLARDYVAGFDYVAGDVLGFTAKAKRKIYNVNTKETTEETYQRDSIRATFESMDSPKEYNFTTDRVYAHIPLAVMRALLKRSKAEKHATLSAVIRERFTSRDGFISGYRNTLDSWLAKPLQDWDHNELGTLLIAAMRAADADPEESETRHRLYESTVGDEGAYQAWEAGVDWKKFESKRAEKRAEKLADWISEDCDAAMIWRFNHADEFAALKAADPSLFVGFDDSSKLPYRCPETPDFFA